MPKVTDQGKTFECPQEAIDVNQVLSRYAAGVGSY